MHRAVLRKVWLLLALVFLFSCEITFLGGTAHAQPAPLRTTKKKPRKPSGKTPKRDIDDGAPSPYRRMQEEERTRQDREVPIRDAERAPPEDRDRAPDADGEAPSDDARATESSPKNPVEATSPPAPTADDEEKTPSLGPINGRLFAYGRMPYDGPYQQLSASAWAGVRPRFTTGTYGKLVLSGDIVSSKVAPGDTFRGRVREGYLGARSNGWDFRLGQQIIPWGSADFVNPTDLLTARDYTFFSADPEASRIGSLSAMLAYAVPDTGWEFTLVLTPLFPVSRAIIPPRYIPAGVRLANPQRPDFRLDRTEIGAKIKYAGEGWDLALVGFNGFEHVPHFEPGTITAPSVTPPSITIERRYHRHVAVGLDGSLSAGQWTLRGEGTFVRTGNPDEAERYAPPSYVQGVVGVERPFLERFRAMAQFIMRVNYPAFDPTKVPARDPAIDPAAAQQDQIERAVYRANAILFNFQDVFRPATTLRVSYDTEDEKLSVEAAGMWNLVGNDFAVRIMGGYRPLEALLLQIGYEQFAGRRTRPFGAIESLSGAFAQATFSF